MAIVDPEFRGHRRVLLSTAAVCCLLTACAQPQPGPTATQVVVVADAPATLSDTDQRFLVAAAGTFHYQREAARLAVQRGTDPGVKAYAALLADHHGRVCQELRQMVEARKLHWPEGIAAERRAALDALAALPTGTFDRRFIEQVGIADQQADLEMFEKASRTVNDLALRAWATRIASVIQEQIASARSLPIRPSGVA